MSAIPNWILSLPLPVVGLKMRLRSPELINCRCGQWRPGLTTSSKRGWVPPNLAHQKIHHRPNKPQWTPILPCITEKSNTCNPVALGGNIFIVDKYFLVNYKTHHCAHQGKYKQCRPSHIHTTRIHKIKWYVTFKMSAAKGTQKRKQFSLTGFLDRQYS